MNERKLAELAYKEKEFCHEETGEGNEFVSKILDQWGYENHVMLDFSRPGKPTDNAFIESFNGNFRDVTNTSSECGYTFKRAMVR